MAGELDMVQWLALEGGTDLQARDAAGASAVALAGAAGRVSVLRWLLLQRRRALAVRDYVVRACAHSASSSAR